MVSCIVLGRALIYSFLGVLFLYGWEIRTTIVAFVCLFEIQLVLATCIIIVLLFKWEVWQLAWLWIDFPLVLSCICLEIDYWPEARIDMLPSFIYLFIKIVVPTTKKRGKKVVVLATKYIYIFRSHWTCAWHIIKCLQLYFFVFCLELFRGGSIS